MIVLADIFRNIVKRVSNDLGYDVNYQFGEWKQISAIMEKMSKSSFSEMKKYPLIALFTPIIEDKSIPNLYCQATVRMLIATRTLSGYTNEQRLAISYKEKLYPAYESLIKNIQDEKLFDFGPRSVVEHRYSDNMRYGSRGVYGSDEKIPFCDLFDGIDIMDLKIRVKPENNCKRIRI